MSEADEKPDNDVEVLKHNLAYHIREAALILSALTGRDPEVMACESCKGTGILKKERSSLILPN